MQTLPIKLRTIAAAAVVIASGLIIFTAYQSMIFSDGNVTQAVPVITAQDTPYRVRPDTPGGMEIPNADNTLYRLLDEQEEDRLALAGITLNDDDAPVSVEDVLNETQETLTGFDLPEIPQTRTESLYDMMETLDPPKAATTETVRDLKKTETSDSKIDILQNEEPQEDLHKAQQKRGAGEKEEETETVETAETVKEAAGTTAAPGKTADAKISETAEIEAGEAIKNAAVTPKDKPQYDMQQNPEQKNAAPDATQKPAAKTFSVDRILGEETVAKKRYYIQLASLKSREAAEAAYARIRDRHPALVEGAGVFFPQADLGARGLFTRIQIGPFEKAEADKRCQTYRDQKGGTCLVLSR